MNLIEPNMSSIFTIQNIIIYAIAINLIAFLAMYIDKKKAEKGRWRIKEGTLMLLVLLGGGIRWDFRNVSFQTQNKEIKIYNRFSSYFNS